MKQQKNAQSATVCITGASSGIGKATAYAYAKKGYNLILTARREEQLKEICTDIEAAHTDVAAEYIVADLSNTAEVTDFWKQVEEKKVHIAVFVNNAGFGTNGSFTSIDEAKELSMIDLNIKALTQLAKYALKKFEQQGSGTLVNIASTASFVPLPNMAVYAATKAYVLSLSEALYMEQKSNKDITVIAICPGPTKTEFADQLQNKSGIFESKGLPTATDLAHFLVAAVEKKKPVAVHGFQNKLLSKTVNLLPRRLIYSMLSRM